MAIAPVSPLPLMRAIAEIAPVVLRSPEAVAEENKAGLAAPDAALLKAAVSQTSIATPALASGPQAAVMQATAQAVTRQTGAAGMMADLAMALLRPDLPGPARMAVERLMDLRTPLLGQPSAAELRQAVERSGIFLEAKLADPQRAADAAPGQDMKAAMLALRQTLQFLTGPASPPPTGRKAEPPPFRGGPTSAQAPQGSTLPTEGEPLAALLHMKGDVEGALARQTLLQGASLPDDARAAARGEAQWMFEIPFATGQGTAMAQFQISREAKRADPDAPEPVWRAKFSLDMEPAGPVHVQIALSPGAPHVGLWAERTLTAERLARRSGELALALSGPDGPAQVLVRAGEPARTEAPAGHFVDRAL